MIDLRKLFEPFAPDKVSWRVGSTTKDKAKGMALVYLDSRDVMERLDAVCGPENWQCSYPHADKKTVCRIEIRVGDMWVGKEDGAGDSDIEAEKGALSDAFKRAAVKWGIGRYLYDVESPWVELESFGNSQKIKADQYGKLRAALQRGAVAAPAPAPVVSPPPPAAPSEDDQWVEWAKSRADDYRACTSLGELDRAVLGVAKEMNACERSAPRVHKKLLATIVQCRAILGQAPAGEKAA